jgi:hypothetical protein
VFAAIIVTEVIETPTEEAAPVSPKPVPAVLASMFCKDVIIVSCLASFAPLVFSVSNFVFVDSASRSKSSFEL